MKNMSKKALKLHCDPKRIRNVCILAHVDHGKTTLADSLIASNGVISQRLAGKIRYMDSRKDEQERGITMKSSMISLQYIQGEQDFLVNVIDSPGHVDFYGEVSTALRLCDGAIIVIDVIEGICPQTIVALRQAWTEHIKPILVMNKLDRLILERKFTPLDAFVHIQQVLEQANAVMGELFTTDVLEKSSKTESVKTQGKDSSSQLFDWSSGLEETDDSTLYFSPDQGNVLFASAFDGWGFGVSHFAKLYSKKLGIKEELLKKTLWGDFYLNSKTKQIMKGAQMKSKKPLFVQFILENIWSVYEAIVTRRCKETTAKIINSLGLKIADRDLRHADPKVQLQAVCGQWLPLASAILEMVCEKIPSPSELSVERVKSLICSTTHNFDSLPEKTQQLKSDFLACSSSSEAPVIICVSKMFPVEASLMPQNKQRPLTVDEIQQRREMVREKQTEIGMEASLITDNEPEKKTLTSETVFIAFARIFSGTITCGQELFVLGPKHNPSRILNRNIDDISLTLTLKDLKPDQHITRVIIKDLYLLMGKELERLESVTAGNIIGIGGLEEHVLKSATLSTTVSCPPFVDLNSLTVPILRVALEPALPSNMQILVDGLKLLNQADPCVQVLIQETGEHVLITAGEVHLERCLDDLKERFAKIEINVSTPIVPFRETVVLPPKIDMVNEIIDDHNLGARNTKVIESIKKDIVSSLIVKTANGRSIIKLKCIPLPEKVVELLEENVHLLKLQKESKVDSNKMETLASFSSETLKQITELRSNLETRFKEAGPDWEGAENEIWSFGPRHCGSNVLLNRTNTFKKAPIWVKGDSRPEPVSVFTEYDSSFVSGFQLATLSGPLCEEPMMGVCFLVEEWTIQSSRDEEDNQAQGTPFGPFAGQIMSIVKEACRKSFQMQPQRLMAAMYSCTIQVTAEALGKMYAVLGRRNGRVLSADMQEGSQRFTVTAVLPVIESFDFAGEIRKQTSGLASPQLLFSHWEVVDMDPFWVPTTEEEYLHFGEKADSENRGRKYMNSVRRRKGLAVDEKIVEHAEKQRTLTKNK